ncbi:hypothetical protein ACFFIX_10500 [Metabacillus herbersteinensis]|uniref:dUTPase-like domain-containing protein n=1 Tax=Metabacillus herbersteinensis TaxID=283816 RepID=A0ABV6GEQ6_9BACI
MLLSDVDIRRELVDGENIMVYPLKLENIKGSSINLTASKYAWRISDGDSAVVGNKIRIPAHETVCIYTEESLWVSRRIGGTYHSKVSQVSTGLGHISTTLDPQWLGLSLIAVSNPTKQPIEILIGSTFVSVMLSYLQTPATKGKNENAASRQDISSRFHLTDEDKEFLRKEMFRSYDGLKAAMLSSPNYQIITKERDEALQAQQLAEQQQATARKEFKQTFWYPLSIGLVGALVGGILSIIGNIIVVVYFK